MNVLLIVAVAIIIFSTLNYDKWSCKKWYERCEVNSRHPDWYPKCGINFLEKDPQWFIDNGYENYVKK